MNGFLPEELVRWLPTVNAGLNLLATVLLVTGFVLIKRGREIAHRRAMLAAFVASVLFLMSYLTYHADSRFEMRRFEGPSAVRTGYLVLLTSHIILAALVPVLAVVTIYLGLKDRRRGHRRLARWTFPIWLYVSITGVVVYLMLYHLYPAQADGAIIPTGL